MNLVRRKKWMNPSTATVFWMNKRMNENFHELNFLRRTISEWNLFRRNSGKKLQSWYDRCHYTEVNNNCFSSDKIICAVVFFRCFMNSFTFFSGQKLLHCRFAFCRHFGYEWMYANEFSQQIGKMQKRFWHSWTYCTDRNISDVVYQNVLSSQCAIQ